MKLLSIIAEYNPFHNGHAHHLKISKDKTKCTHTLSIMSGSFLQRGEPSLIDKWTRAKIAVENGIDLVIELPFVYSSQTAEIFAYGAIKTLYHLNLKQSLSFGCEYADITVLQNIAKILAEEPEKFVKALRTCLQEGLSYPKSREIAVQECIDLPNQLMSSSNNILAIEYLKWLYKFDSDINPTPIKRHESSYHGGNGEKNIVGATYIRNKIQSTRSIDSIRQWVPVNTYDQMKKYEEKNKYNFLCNYYTLLTGDLMRSRPDQIRELFDVNEGLENRILKGLTSVDMDDFIKNVATKRYTETRIKRIIVNLMLKHNKDHVNKVFRNKNFYPYIRVLAFNDKGREILREIKANSQLKIITNLSRDSSELNEIQKYCIDKDVLATNYFFLIANRRKLFWDYYKKPEII